MNAKYWFFRVRISGESCWPDLVPGRTYWATNLRQPSAGNFVVLHHPAEGGLHIVKKVLSVTAHSLELGGTVSWSARFSVPKRDVLGTLFSPSRLL